MMSVAFRKSKKAKNHFEEKNDDSDKAHCKNDKKNIRN